MLISPSWDPANRALHQLLQFFDVAAFAFHRFGLLSFQLKEQRIVSVKDAWMEHTDDGVTFVKKGSSSPKDLHFTRKHATKKKKSRKLWNEWKAVLNGICEACGRENRWESLEKLELTAIAETAGWKGDPKQIILDVSYLIRVFTHHPDPPLEYKTTIGKDGIETHTAINPFVEYQLLRPKVTTLISENGETIPDDVLFRELLLEKFRGSYRVMPTQETLLEWLREARPIPGQLLANHQPNKLSDAITPQAKPSIPEWINELFRGKQNRLLKRLWDKRWIPENELFKILDYENSITAPESLRRLVSTIVKNLCEREEAIGELFTIESRTREKVKSYQLIRQK